MSEWNGYCHRCREETNRYTMSWFSTELICDDCSDREETHSEYNQARQVEMEHVISGNYNFEGIGYTEE